MTVFHKASTSSSISSRPFFSLMANFPAVQGLLLEIVRSFPFVLRAHRVLTDGPRGICVRGAAKPYYHVFSCTSRGQQSYRSRRQTLRHTFILIANKVIIEDRRLLLSNELESIIRGDDAISRPCGA